MKLSGDINSVQQLKLEGSISHDGFISFQQQFEPYFRKYSELSQAANKSGVTDSLMQLYRQLVDNIAAAGERFAAEKKTRWWLPLCGQPSCR